MMRWTGGSSYSLGKRLPRTISTPEDENRIHQTKNPNRVYPKSKNRENEKCDVEMLDEFEAKSDFEEYQNIEDPLVAEEKEIIKVEKKSDNNEFEKI
jgi:hypothetical protein